MGVLEVVRLVIAVLMVGMSVVLWIFLIMD